MALNAKIENVTLNVKLRNDSGFESRNWEHDSRYRAKEKQRLWTLNWRYDSECQGDDAALNAESKKEGGSKCQTGKEWWLRTSNWAEIVTLNAETGDAALNNKNDFEC